MSVIVKIENTYEDGHESTFDFEVEDPEDVHDLEDWWEERVWPLTGDGHGTDNNLGAWYEATITRADNEALVGLSMEWS